MKSFKDKKYLITFLFIGLFMSFGCRPSVREVVKVVIPIPLGSSRDEVKKTLFEAYSKKYPDKASKQGYMFTEPPLQVTSGMIKSHYELIIGLKRGGHYVRIFPEDLFEKISTNCFFEGIGLVAETSEGNGSVTIYYDSHTNYIGFIAESEFGKKDK